MVGPVSTQSGSTESASASPATRKGPLGHPAVLVLAGIAVLLGAYALGYMPVFGSLLEDAFRSSQSADVPVLSPAFYGIAGLAAFLILLGLLKSFDLLVRKIRKSTPLKTRPAKPVDRFIEEAGAEKICVRVARESYYLLEPHYPYRMCIDLNDSLRGDLRLADEAIKALEAQLLTRCDRRQAPVTPSASSAASPALNFVTVFDLLHRAETAPTLREDRSGSRERVTDSAALKAADGTPIVEKRQSDSAQRKALHAATLQAIETGSLHAAGASGLHRRASDYSGPRRRATDNRADPEFKGPYQRTTDRVSAERPRTLSGERKAVPAAPDPAELNRRDPLFIPPLNKRFPEPTR